MSETARALDMPRSNLYKKIERYGLTRETRVMSTQGLGRGAQEDRPACSRALSDEALLPAKSAKTPQARGRSASRSSAHDVDARRHGCGSLLATALGVGMLFWPYDATLRAGLAGYLAAIGVVVAGGRLERRLDLAASLVARPRPVAAARFSGAACSARSRSCRASATRSPIPTRPGWSWPCDAADPASDREWLRTFGSLAQPDYTSIPTARPAPSAARLTTKLD